MQTWLKVIGSGQTPITAHPFYGTYKEAVGFRKAKKPRIRMGDHLFLYAAGGSKRIFALAEATGDPQYDINRAPQDDCRWKLAVRYLVNRPVAAGIHIDEIATGERDLMVSIRQQSHIKLTQAECQLAYSKLRVETHRRQIEPENVYPEVLPDNREYYEGAVRRIAVNAYERDPRARAECLRSHGTKCKVCDLSFEERYGSIGKDFIHVHHLKPLATLQRASRLDPVKDLAPVCPNCHAMLHTSEPPLSIEELKEILAKIAAAKS